MKKLFLISAFFLLSACGVQDATSQTTAEQATTTSSETIPKTTRPTLFIHGYSGGPASFGKMLGRFQQADISQQELTVTVAPDGSVTSSGSLSGNADNPTIQVLFTDNKNNEWNQTEWIKNVLLFFKETYDVTSVDLVGHSMGGVSGLRYLLTYGGEQDLPAIDHFVAIGAPFNDFLENADQTIEDELATGPVEKADRYQDYQQMIGNLPTNTQILLIAGQLSPEDLSDGTVPLTSAVAVYSLLKAQGNPLKLEIVEGKNAQHSQLHENPQVDNYVSDFLWDLSTR